MLRDSRASHRNSANVENLDPMLDPSAAPPELDPSRPPLNAIQQNNPLATDQDVAAPSSKRKADRTPSKTIPNPHPRPSLRTPDRSMTAVTLGRNRFGWASRTDSDSGCGEMTAVVPRGLGFATPRPFRNPAGASSSAHSDTSSTHSTPNRSVNKPPNPVLAAPRPSIGAVPRAANYAAASRGAPMCSLPASVINSPEVPHLELKEDPSFWMDHNVQVVIRVRPLNGTEISQHGHNRCLRQESAQSISWIGQPEARFTFDHVACETINQETLFRVAGLPMVENCISGYNSCMFAYGQTGSGKTYTMLGEIDELEVRPKPNRGMTPRIFEFLFARIKAEEESRKDEKLKYSCRCSFLEIYNEQITDLLDPSSTNLLVREDIQRGVYVENLSEFAVENVNDVLKLLVQGAANRKVAATNMNRESSRSHGVFTCIIESQWEKDSLTSLRFARLNLVDLAGSERQKTSGAEGERLKEAANINKSLSTLGHVMMLLADVAQGKQRHIPYRDSRLTFLLQDSLGGNSKTIIIAGVSPSICCASESLSTLKFAQRAKLVQNNAIINEDASGDVMALRHQIRLLKEELSMLKRQNVSRSLSFRTAIFQDSDGEKCDPPYTEKTGEETLQEGTGLQENEALAGIIVSTSQLKSLEAILAGALRREKMADTAIKNLEAEIEQLNRLVRQREEDTRCIRMMLRFREEKIQKMENIVNGLVPAESYWQEEKKSLTEEIQLLRAKEDRNPEVIRFALENIRLLDQLRRFQEFYEEGERAMLLEEVSELRNQLVTILDGKSELAKGSNPITTIQETVPAAASSPSKENNSFEIAFKRTSQEFEDCRSQLKCCLEANEKLTREINDLRAELDGLKAACNQDDMDVELQDMEICYGTSPLTIRQSEKVVDVKCDSPLKHSEEIVNLQLELDILKTIILEERSLRSAAEEKFMQINYKYEHIAHELQDARMLIKSLESQQIVAVQEVELKKNSEANLGILKQQEAEIFALKKNLGTHFAGETRESVLLPELSKWKQDLGESDSPLQMKLKKMQASLDKARILNLRFQDDLKAQSSNEQEMDEVCRQVEAETAEVIVCLQEELTTLQKQVEDSSKKEQDAKERILLQESEIRTAQDKLCMMSKDNECLIELLHQKDEALACLSEEREELACEIVKVLADGDMALDDAIDQAGWIADNFSQRSWIGEQVNRMIRSLTEKNSLINELHKSLEDAENVKCDMEWKLRSLRGAMVAITEAQGQNNDDKESEIHHLQSRLSEKMSNICDLEGTIKNNEDQIRRAELYAAVAFLVVKRLTEVNLLYLDELEKKELCLMELMSLNIQKDSLLQNQISLCSSAEEQFHLLCMQTEEDHRNIAELKARLDDEQTHFLAVERQQWKEDNAASNYEDELSKTEEGLKQLNLGLDTIYSCMDVYSREGVGPEETLGSHGDESSGLDKEDQIVTESDQYISEVNNIDSVVNDSEDRSVCIGGYYPCEYKAKTCSSIKKLRHSKDLYDKEITILLLRKEIESSLKCLNGVQIQMNQLLQEKEAVKNSGLQKRKDIEHLFNLVLMMDKEMNDKEQLVELKLLALDRKVKVHEDKVKDAMIICQKNKSDIMLEVGEAKAIAAEKNAEALLLLSQFENAREMMKEAEIMVNALMLANESAKLEVKKLLERERSLMSERDLLLDELSLLRSSLDKTEQKFGALEERCYSNMAELEGMLRLLESMFVQVQASFGDELKLVLHDVFCFRSVLVDSIGLARKWLEEIWSEIVQKDCAMSILHHCHLGFLLEAITGLNTENRLLLLGLNDSNRTIANLREQNVRSRKEFEMSSLLKGKLLIDINHSFNRISKNEKEAGEVLAKIASLDKKITELQSQEEYMLARSDAMGSELAVLIEQFDCDNKKGLLGLLSKDLEIHFLTSELREKVADLKEKVFLTEDLEAEKCKSCGLLENLEREIVLSNINGDLKSLLLEEIETNIAILTEEAINAHIQLDNSVRNSCNLGLRLKRSEDRISELEGAITKLEEGLHEKILKEMELRAEIDKQLNDLGDKGYQLKKSEQYVEMVTLELKERDIEIETLHHELQIMTSDYHTQIKEGAEEAAKLSLKLQHLQDENATLLDNLLINDVMLQCSNCFLAACSEANRKFQWEIISLGNTILKLESELETRKMELADVLCCNSNIVETLDKERSEKGNLHTAMKVVHDQNIELKEEVENLRTDHSRMIHDLQENRGKLESSSLLIHERDAENIKLQETICSLQACISSLQTNLDDKTRELDETLHSLSSISEVLLSKSQECSYQERRSCSLESEKRYLRGQLLRMNHVRDQISSAFESNRKGFTDTMRSIDKSVDGLGQTFYYRTMSFLDNLLCNFSECTEKISDCLEQVVTLELSTNSLVSENLLLHSELMRRGEMSEKLMFDLTLLQQSASYAQDQKNKLEEMEAAFHSLEAKFSLQSDQLEETIDRCQKIESHLLEKGNLVSYLESELRTQQESMKIVSQEKFETSYHLEELSVLKNSLESELVEKTNLIKVLEAEMLKMRKILDQQQDLEGDLKDNVIKLREERKRLNFDVATLKEQLTMARTVSEANEAIAAEAQQMAESSKHYADGKEEEVKLLEKSIEELECTIDVLQTKVDFIKGEAERHRLQREDLEMELQIVKCQLLDPQVSDFHNVLITGKNVPSRCGGEEECATKELEKKTRLLKQNLEDKDAEIIQYKAHISELNAHAEAQAQQNIQKIKELESMVQQVKTEASTSNVASTAATREKSATKSRGSGSPFKCIGLGVSQQINSEKEEELTAGRLRIQELEVLAAKQQKEIFELNTRLAASESMTHDVIRDLLGVKLDITNYASMVDNQVGKSEFSFHESKDFKEKVQEVDKLKQHLNELIEERQGWLDDISKRQTEMMAMKVTLEKLRQRDQFLTAENEILKGESVKHKKIIMQLECELEKNSSQHNMQQRIHHHAKIKEENHLLKAQKQELAARLQRSEEILSRVKEELAHYRSCYGKAPYIDIDEEERLKVQLEDAEREREQLAHKLVSLSSNILKVAGIREPMPDKRPLLADDALSQLKDRITSLESELQDVKVKSKINDERIRLDVLRQDQASPLCSRKGGGFLR